MTKIESALNYILWAIPNTKYTSLNVYLKQAEDDLKLEPSEVVLIENAVLEVLFDLEDLDIHELMELYKNNPSSVNKFGKEIYFTGCVADLAENEMIRRMKQ